MTKQTYYIWFPGNGVGEEDATSYGSEHGVIETAIKEIVPELDEDHAMEAFDEGTIQICVRKEGDDEVHKFEVTREWEPEYFVEQMKVS